MASGEKIKQKLGMVSSFQPTSNDRTKNMYRELRMHSKLIKGLQKHVRKLEIATDGMLGQVEKAYLTELPHDYSVETKTQIEARSAPVAQDLGVDRQAKQQEVTGLRATLTQRMQEEVHAPAEAWLGEVVAAKVDLKELETTRLELDAQRRAYYKGEAKKVKKELNTGGVSESFKGRVANEGDKLTEARTRWEAKEQEVYEKLRGLVSRSSVIFDCMEKAFAVGNDVMNSAQSAAPPTPSAQPPPKSTDPDGATPFASGDKRDPPAQLAISEPTV